MNMRYRDSVGFNIPLTASNYTDPRFSDKWGHFNDMYLGVTTPNGYILGTTVPPSQGRTFSVTGTDSSRFSINATTGELSLSNNSGLAEGTLNINIVASDLGSFAITIPVVSSSTSILFVDPTNGNDLNSGREPHLAKRTYDPAALSNPTIQCIKRGQILDLAVAMEFRNGTIFKGYGDPSLPKWGVRTEGGFINQFRNARKANGISAQGCSNVEIRDCNMLGGSTIQRNVDAYNVTNIAIKRCYFTGNIDHANSSGFSVNNNSSNFVFKFNETSGSLYGDGGYITATNSYDIQFNIFRSPNGTAGDCLQISDEGNVDQRCFDGYIAYNIASFGTTTTSGKGCLVISGTDYVTVEHNFIPRGNYFGISTGAAHIIIRHNYCFESSLNTTNNNEYGIGFASDNPSLAIDIYDNYCIRGARTISISENGSLWKRDDIFMQYNTIALSNLVPVRITVANTCDMQKNIFCSGVSNTTQSVGQGTTVSVNSGTISGFTSNGDGTGYFTTNTGVSSHAAVGDTITVTTASIPTDYTLLARQNGGSRLVVASAMSTDSVARTWERKKRYGTQNISNNTSQLALGTGLSLQPTLSGNCQNGQTVTASYTLPQGHTGLGEWVLNGRVATTGDSYAIPALTSASTDINGCRANGRNSAKLSFRLTITDPNGNISYVKGIWPDSTVYKTVIA